MWSPCIVLTNKKTYQLNGNSFDEKRRRKGHREGKRREERLEGFLSSKNSTLLSVKSIIKCRRFT